MFTSPSLLSLLQIGGQESQILQNTFQQTDQIQPTNQVWRISRGSLKFLVLQITWNSRGGGQADPALGKLPPMADKLGRSQLV